MILLYFIGCDTAQINTGFSVIDAEDTAVFSTCFGREIPEETKGKDIPDFKKNYEQLKLFKHYIDLYLKKDSIGMIVFEGPDYGGSNITQISIGSIHGAYWQFCMERELNFAIVTPKSVNYSVFGTAKDIKKRDTIAAMKDRYQSIKIRDSNMADSLAMASLARKFYYLMHGGVELTKGEKEVLLSEKKLKGEKKGLIYKRDKKYVLFD